MALDLVVIAAALLPVLWRAHEVGALLHIASPGCFTLPLWWACLAGLSMLYGLHGFIWNFPETYTALTRRLPLSLLGDNPVKVFAVLEILGKFWQASMCYALLGTEGVSTVLEAARASPAWCWCVLALYLIAGQGLNAGIYAAIGNDGVYYGFKLGRPVPWCTGFPFNIGLRHPQYVGVVLTLLGATTVMIAAPLALFVQLMLAWAGMYVVMSVMEQLGDNNKKVV